MEANNQRPEIDTATGRKFLRDFYIYQTSVSGLAASASDTDIINIETDANFIVEKTTYFAEVAGDPIIRADRIVPLVSVSITDSGSGRNLQSEAVPIDSMAGNGELPFVWPVPRVFKANATINVSFTNFSAATTYTTIFLSFIGYKKFFYS